MLDHIVLQTPSEKLRGRIVGAHTQVRRVRKASLRKFHLSWGRKERSMYLGKECKEKLSRHRE